MKFGEEGRAVEHFAIDDAGGEFALGESEEVGGGFEGIVAGEFLRPGEAMRRKEDVGARADGCVGGQRFGFKYIEARARDPSFVEGFDQVRFVDDGAACGVDQDRGGLHQTEEIAIDETASGGAESAVNAEIVCMAGELFEANQLDVERGCRGRGYEGIVGDEATEAERSGEAEHFGSDVAESDGAEGAAGDVAAERWQGVTPAVGFNHLVLGDQVERGSEDEGDGGFGDGTANGVRRDGEDDVGAGEGCGVDAVEADAPAGDDREALEADEVI